MEQEILKRELLLTCKNKTQIVMRNSIHRIKILIRYIDLHAWLDYVQKAGKIIFPKKSLRQNGFRTAFLDTEGNKMRL